MIPEVDAWRSLAERAGLEHWQARMLALGELRALAEHRRRLRRRRALVAAAIAAAAAVLIAAL